MTDIQKVILEIFKEVSSIFEKHKLRYFAIGGTCIGAVRHKGFIPWDDDMDIVMPIEDYVKFIELCKTELPEHLEVFSQERASRWTLPFIKVIDSRTMMTSYSWLRWKDTYTGVWIDIMPMIGLPSSKKGQKIVAKEIPLLRRVQWHGYHGFPVEKSLKAMLFWFLLTPLRLIITPAHFWKLLIKFWQRHPFDPAEYVTFLDGSGGFDRKSCPKKWFENFVSFPFEDTFIHCPKDYHELLTLIFGDYMTPPPEEERVTHCNDGIVDLEHSYKDYQCGKFMVPKQK